MDSKLRSDRETGKRILLGYDRHVKPSDPNYASALVNKRWDLLAEIGDQFERDCKAEGLGRIFAIMDELRLHLRVLAPSWPTAADLEEDHETHRRLAETLARTARPGPTSSRRKGDRRVQRARR